MNCRDVEDYIVPYIENELSPAMRTWMHEHLEDCTLCGELQLQLQQFEMPQIPEPTVEQMLRMQNTLDQNLHIAINHYTKPIKTRRLPYGFVKNTAPIALLVFLILGLSALDVMDGISADKYPSSASAGIVTPDKHWF